MKLPSMARVAEVYREEGAAPLARRGVERLLGRTPAPSPAYQQKREAAVDERWRIIQGVIGGPGSLLDIGCNLGDLTQRAARSGMFAVGLDVLPKVIARAIERHADVADCAFMTMAIDSTNVETLPTFDVVLCLSVHHNWVDAEGPEKAADILRALVKRSNRVMVFEGPARQERFGSFDPGFVDNDEASVTAYYEEYLAKELGDLVSRIEPLGKTANHDPEPYRWAWALHR